MEGLGHASEFQALFSIVQGVSLIFVRAFGGKLPETGRLTKYCVVQILRSLFLGSAL